LQAVVVQLVVEAMWLMVVVVLVDLELLQDFRYLHHSQLP
jgi:hypothetical protein